MPFHIDRWRGSPDVRAMHPAARMGYLELLCSCWQSSDCSISDDAIDLATNSGLGDELWVLYGARILRKFVLVDGRYRNEVLFEEWSEALRVYQKRKSGAVRTNSSRTANEERTDTERPADTETRTETSTSTKTKAKKQKLSRAKAAIEKIPDPRHDPFKKAYMGYVENMTGLEAGWDGYQATALNRFLSGSPKINIEHWAQILANRRLSDVTHGEPLSAWIVKAKTFYSHPLDRFGKPLGGSNGSANGHSKEQDIRDVNQQLIAKWEAKDLASRNHHHGGVAEAWDARVEPGSEGEAGRPLRLTAG